MRQRDPRKQAEASVHSPFEPSIHNNDIEDKISEGEEEAIVFGKKRTSDANILAMKKKHGGFRSLR